MNKHFYITTIALCLVNTHMSLGMKAQEEGSYDGHFKQYTARIPLMFPPTQTTPVVTKDVFVLADNCNTMEEANAYFEKNDALILKDLEATTRVCVALMFANDKGWHFPANPPMMQRINPELLALVKLPKTYFIFSREFKNLILRWDLGEQPNGWGFDKVIEVKQILDHPRRGACSELTVQYHHKAKGIHGKVALSDLREHYIKAGMTTNLTPENIAHLSRVLTAEKCDELHAQDLVKMALHYVSNPENIK